jgi:hypothetical protein
MTTRTTFSALASDALLAKTVSLAADERLATGQLIAALAEVDARELYLGEGCSSLFVYCTRVLHLSEHAAYSRIEAARAARRFPAILDLLIEGALTLTSVTLLSPHLTEENSCGVLEAARHKSKREVEMQVAALRPRPAVAASIRKLPERQQVAALVATPLVSQPDAEVRIVTPVVLPARPPVVKPLTPEQYKIQFTIPRDTHEKLRRAQDLLRHSIPDGNLAKIFDKAAAAAVRRRIDATVVAAQTASQNATTIAANARVPSAQSERRSHPSIWPVPPAPVVACSARSGATFLELHVAPGIRVCGVLPQKQPAVFLIEVVVRRTDRRREC